MALPSGDASFTLKKQRGNGYVVDAGLVVIRKCELSFPYSFNDYVNSGTIIKSVVAIDMSNTNGNLQEPTSLLCNKPLFSALSLARHPHNLGSY